MKKFLSDFKIPLILIIEIIVCLSFGDIIPEHLKSGAYALSLTLKEILLFVLPFVIFSFLFNSIGTLKRGAFSFVALAFSLVIISNFTTSTLGGLIGIFGLGTFGLVEKITLSTQSLEPLWVFDFSPLVSNDIALFSGMGVGIIMSFWGNKTGQELAQKMQSLSLSFLKNCFTPVLPLFILGFIFKMQSDGLLTSVFKHYLPIALIVIVVAVTYTLSLLALAVRFDRKLWLENIKNLVPGMITGFTTMSSASTLPLVIEAVEKTAKEKFTAGVVPVSSNIHSVGDCFSISVQAIAILISFGYPLPTMPEFFLFIAFFVMARFAVAGVAGGGILVALPILEKYLGFNGEMLSLITALYILFDPLMTPVNVLGHGTFAHLFERAYRKIAHKKNRGPVPQKELS